MNETNAILTFPEYQIPAQKLALSLDLPLKTIAVHTFPDGECRVTLPEYLPQHIIICRSLYQPNNKLIELMLGAAAARESGVQKITLVAPYLCYMRQDIAFQPGEAISQRIVAGFLSKYIDVLITVDPHLHRISNLDTIFPQGTATSLSSAEYIAGYLKSTLDDPLLIGPDTESEQWVQRIAQPFDMDYVIAAKKRVDDHTVRVELPEYDFAGRNVIIVDDIASTGRTLAATAGQLRLKNVTNIHAMVTHALFVNNAESVIRTAGIKNVWSTDSIPHHTNVISLASLFAQALEKHKL